MLSVRAEITALYNGKAYTKKSVSSITDTFVDSALDTDTDSWQITIGDFDRNLIPLLQRDSEVRASLFVEGAGQFENLHSGIADEVAWNDEGVMVINGRDFTSVAVDSVHPPARFKGGRPHVIVANEARKLGIGNTMKLTKTASFQQLVTDGSESYWTFWYRLYRKRSMWLWAEPDGSLVGSTLNYNQNPAYYFGDNFGLAKKFDKYNFIPVERMEWRANKNQRVYEVYVIGQRGDKIAFVQRAVDPSMKGWVKKRTNIITSRSAHGPGEARAEALEELFESKVGATEIVLTIADPGIIIRQNKMCFVNISKAGIRGDFYVVGSKVLASVDGGLLQEVRLRERNYAISKRQPNDPVLNNGPGDETMYGNTPNGLGPTNPAGSISEGISLATNTNWGQYFVESADKNRGPWPFALFLGVLVSICDHETKFRNIRYNGSSGPDYPGTRDGRVPNKVTEPKEWNLFVSRYANEPKYGRISAPPGFEQWAVGPMQLYTPSYKEYADRLAGAPIDELIGGRWNPRYNINAGGFALRSKLKGIESALQGGNPAQAYSLIWQGVQAYGGSPQYMREIKSIYDNQYAEAVTAAIENASAINKSNVDQNFEIPQGSAAELLSQMKNNKNITLSGVARGDLDAGRVAVGLQLILLSFANAGFTFSVWGFKTGHGKYTSSGSISDHWTGHAADLGPYDRGDRRHEPAQRWLVEHAKKLKIRQIIGPSDKYSWDFRQPTGYYGPAVLAEHDNHIHLSVIWDRPY